MNTASPDFWDTIIIGAGPAGIACSIHAAGGGRVLLLEKNPDPGRKLRMSGSGQCNITHGGEIRAFFSRYGDHGTFLKPALLNYPNRNLLAFLESEGLSFEEETEGKVFPVSRKASDVLAALLHSAQTAGVTILCGEPVIQVQGEEGSFVITTPKQTLRAGKMVITTGGKSYPGTGSTGDGYEFARALGHTIVPPRPALTPVYPARYPFSDLSGISFPEAWLSVFRNEKKIGEHEGPLLLTHKGFSGPGILDFSRYMEIGDSLQVSFLQKRESACFSQEFIRLVQESGNKRIRAILGTWPLPERFILMMLELNGIPPETTCAHLPADARKRLIVSLTMHPFTIERLGGFEEAMATRGGIDLREVDSRTMESRIVAGLYFAGEVLDIDGDTGGFNLQAAFSTGVLAGESIARRIPVGKKKG